MNYLVSAAVFGLMVLFMRAVGGRFLEFFNLEYSSRSEATVFSLAAGYGLVAYLVFVLGFFRVLYAQVFIVIAVVISMFIYKDILRAAGGVFSFLKRIPINIPDNRYRFLAVVVSIGAVIGFIGALAPSYSYDSMAYHLTDARYFAENHMVGEIPFNSVNALWPYLVEMYYTLSLLLGLGPMSCLFHYLAGVIAAASAFAFCRRFLTPNTGIMAASIVLFVPGIFMEASETYVDLGSVMYNIMAVYAVIVFSQTRKVRWAFISGMMCGLAMSVKYFAIVTPLITGMYMLSCLVVYRRRQYFLGIAALAGGTVLFSFAWYLRQYIVLGNPFFPFFTGIFGYSGLDPDVLYNLSEAKIRDLHGTSTGLIHFLSVPWRITMFPGRFGGEQLGPVFLGFLPGVFLLRKVHHVVKILGMISFAYFVIWFLQYQNLRFLLPIVPLMAIVIAYVISGLEASGRWVGRAALGVFAVYLMFSFLLLGYHNAEALKVVLGAESERSYLQRNERSYGVSEYLNASLDQEDRILVAGDNNTYFIEVPHKREIFYWIYDRYDEKVSSPGEVFDYFKDRGFTYILFADKPYGGYDQLGKGLRVLNLIRDGHSEECLELTKEIRPKSRNSNGIVYKVFRIR